MIPVVRRSARFVGPALPLLVVVATMFVAGHPLRASTPESTTDFYSCTPLTVGSFYDRVHVLCSVAAPGGISYFAYCTSFNSANASRMLSIFTAAKATGKDIGMYYDPDDLNGTACGCQTSNCRVISGAEIRP